MIFTLLLSCQEEQKISSNPINDKSKKILVTAVSKLIIDEKISQDSSSKILTEYLKISKESAERGLDYAYKYDRLANQSDLIIRNEYNDENESNQNDFILKKSEINTREFLQKEKFQLSNWKGRIESIQFSVGTKEDINLLKMGLTPNEVIEKNPDNRDLNILIDLGNYEKEGVNYNILGVQERNFKTDERGITIIDKYYNVISSLETGTDVKVSFKVIDFEEISSKNELSTIFKIKILSIKEI